MNVREYYRELQATIDQMPFVLATELRFDEIDTDECYIRGVLFLVGGLRLHVAEFVSTRPVTDRIKYRYHLQRSDGTLVVRWDNAPHHRDVDGFPHHRHDSEVEVHPSQPMGIEQMLLEIVPYVISESGF